MKQFLVAAGLAVLASASSAQTVGQWSYQLESPYYAATVNDSGNIFGQWCDVEAGSCLYMIALPSRCQEGSEYPVLVNSDQHAMSSTLVCRGQLEGGKYRYAISGFDKIDNIVRTSKRIGLAMPLEGDEFAVYRFSLDGAQLAVSVMRSTVDRASTDGGRKNTRDQRL